MNHLESPPFKKLPFHVKNETADKNVRCVSREGDQPISLVQELMRLSKIENEELLLEIVGTASSGMPTKNDVALNLNVITQTLAETQPQDLHESRLCLHANNLFLQGMYYLDKANKSDPPLAEFYLKGSLKLLRLHNETLLTLNRYRRKSDQIVVVQHVNVHDGGKAIVGHVDGGGSTKK